MSILHVSCVVLGPERSIGVQYKFISQVRALRRLGLSVSALYVADERGGFHENGIDVISLPYNLEERRRDYYAYWRRAFAAMNQWVTSRGADIVYLRYPGADPLIYQWLRNVSVPVVFEHQSKYRLEMLHRGSVMSLLRCGLDVAFARAVLRRAAAHVAVTQEINAYVSGLIPDSKTRICTITNGIDLETVPLRAPPALTSDGLRLLFVGDSRPWHGLDRVMAGLNAYKGTGNITLIVVGSGEEKSAKSRFLPAGVRVDYQGRRTGKELDRLFNVSHVAIAALGIHRQGMEEAATLKVREYLARGIPFVLSHRDPDISGQSEIEQFVLQVPPDDTAVNIAKVVHFAGRATAMPDHAVRLRRWAQAHVDMAVKMAHLKTLLTSVQNNV